MVPGRLRDAPGRLRNPGSNPALAQADPGSGYRFETRQAEVKDKDALVILAFSGGGTRAAAFS